MRRARRAGQCGLAAGRGAAAAARHDTLEGLGSHLFVLSHFVTYYLVVYYCFISQHQSSLFYILLYISYHTTSYTLLYYALLRMSCYDLFYLRGLHPQEAPQHLLGVRLEPRAAAARHAAAAQPPAGAHGGSGAVLRDLLRGAVKSSML